MLDLTRTVVGDGPVRSDAPPTSGDLRALRADVGFSITFCALGLRLFLIHLQINISVLKMRIFFLFYFRDNQDVENTDPKDLFFF